MVRTGFQKGGIAVFQVGIKMYVSIPKLGVQVMFSGLIFSVEVPFSKFANNTEGQCLAYVKAQPVWDLLGCGDHNNMLIHLDGHAILRSDMETILDYCDLRLTGAAPEKAGCVPAGMKGELFLEDNRERLDPAFGF